MRDQRVFQQRLLPLSESRELGGQLGGCRLCVDDGLRLRLRLRLSPRHLGRRFRLGLRLS